jgi:hypothetical protein
VNVLVEHNITCNNNNNSACESLKRMKDMAVDTVSHSVNNHMKALRA